MPSSNLANAPLSPPKRYAADDLFLVASPPRQVTDFLLDRPVLKTQDDMSIGTMPRSDITYDCVVIGTGCAGASAAIALAEEGKKVLAINADEQIVGEKSTSVNQSFRAHTGTHYIGDLETAKQCLDDSLSLARAHPDFFVKNSKTGLYIFVDNTLVPVEIIRENAQKLQEHYRKECKASSAPEPFGDPEKFIEELDPHTIPFVPQTIPYRGKNGEVENTIKPVLAFRVQEPIVDINKVRKYFEGRFEDLKSNLSFLPSHKVVNIAKTRGSLDYAVEAMSLKEEPKGKSSKPTTTFRAKTIVLCAWENNEVLLERLGLFSSALENVVIRLKVSLTIKLPEALLNAESRIYGVGPHFSFTNNGDGTAIVTHEWSTAAGERKAGSLELPAEIKELYGAKLIPEEGKGKEYKDRIMKGSIGYFPELADATVTRVSLGHVKMIINPKEDYSLDGKNSAIHKRTHDGLVEIAPGILAFSGMKMVKALTRKETIQSLAATNGLDLKELTTITAQVREMLVTQKVNKHVADELAYSVFTSPLIDKLKEKDDTNRDNYDRILRADHDDKIAIRKKLSAEFVDGIKKYVDAKNNTVEQIKILHPPQDYADLAKPS